MSIPQKPNGPDNDKRPIGRMTQTPKPSGTTSTSSKSSAATSGSGRKQRKGISIGIILALLLLGGGLLTTGVIAVNQYQAKEALSSDLEQQRVESEAYMINAFTQIEQNLAEIREREDMLDLNNAMEALESGASPEERIVREIAMIESLMLENDRIIDELNEKLKSNDGKLAEYKRTINTLNKRVAEYKAWAEELTAEAEALKGNLAVVSAEKDSLGYVIEAREAELAYQGVLIENQEATIARREHDIRSAFFTVASSRELKDRGVVVRQGGLMSTKGMNPEVPAGEFTRIDRYEDLMIAINRRNAKLVTSHPTDSYELLEQDDMVAALRILDPDRFWASSPYLIVSTRDRQAERETLASR